MLILAGTIRIAAGRRAAATPAIARMLQATRAERGCIRYTFAFDVLDEQLLHIFEVWRDDEALAVHRASPHMAAWRAAAADLGVHDRQLVQYEVSGSRSA
jgi:quinol monooxygenase YgiN